MRGLTPDVSQHHNLEDTSLEYLDLFFQSAVSADGQAVDLIRLMARYANAREMVLAVDEQVDKVGAGLDGLFVDEEEDAAEQDADDSEREEDVDTVMMRLELAIECYTTGESTLAPPSFLS